MSAQAPPLASRTPPRFPRWALVVGVLALALVLLIALWDWNWFRPLVESRASASLGRRVTIQHFSLNLGRQTLAVADGITIANPDGFPQPGDFATIAKLSVTLDAMAYLHGRHIVIPSVTVDKPDIAAAQPDGSAPNWLFPALTSGPPTDPANALKIGDLEIHGGHAHVVVPHLRADFEAAIVTTPGPDSHVTIDAKGTYANQPITGRLVSGALLSLRDAATPYPVNLQLANGPTHISLVGTVKDPIAFAGADLKLDLAGPDMALLFPLTGVPIPKTPSYHVVGNLDYVQGKFLFRQIVGKVGSSDLEGDIEIDAAPQRPIVTAKLSSKLVDLADLGGFIGSEPGRTTTPNQTAEQRRNVARAEASSKLLPTTTISLPKLKSADIHLTYRGAKILGRSMPFDRIAAVLDVDDGKLVLHPVSLGVGAGQIVANLTFIPVNDTSFRTHGDIAVQRLDLGRMLDATHLVHGSGVVGGRATIDTTGNSMATLLGNGTGSLQLFMAGGGDLSALLIDLSGFQIGNALLSALGVPNRDPIRCFIGDFSLDRGVLATRTVFLETEDNIVTGTGTISLRAESLNYRLKTDSKHFSIGTLPAPIALTGPFKDPSIRPDLVTLGARGGAAVGLGILFPPAALLPTIQFGVGEDNRCSAVTRRGN